MCGIAGLLNVGGNRREPLEAMLDAIAHRGPDDRAHWLDDDGSLALGHLRLAIVDLSPAGRQPMISHDGRYVLAFNGEIYNHAELRVRLAQSGREVSWRGHCDSETLLEFIAAVGIDHALDAAHGMFALAVWDRAERRLLLARDRFGEKPLYVARAGAGLAFASELRALLAIPQVSRAIEPVQLRTMLGRGHVSPDSSILRDCRQLGPGRIAEYDRHGQLVSERAYYNPVAVVEAGARGPIEDRAEALTALRDTLGAAVERQLMSDVPLGALLSGGIDSSLIAALATERSPSRLRTYSIGFAEAGFDEAPAARAVAAHLGTDHHELYVTAAEALAVVDRLPAIWNEPFGDASQIPTYLVARFAREEVTVALSGDAGDELFGGYRRHVALPALARRLDGLPAGVRRAVAMAGMRVPPAAWNRLSGWWSGGRRPEFFGHKVRRLFAAASDASGLDSLYDVFLDDWHGYASPVRLADRPVRHPFAAPGLPLETQVMLADLTGYLPGDILTKTDRAAMAVSLEGRVPFLDPQVVALAARIPLRFKIAGGQGKHILRELLHGYVPAALVDRPKAGFAVPIAQWLRGPLRDWAEDLLAGLGEDELLDPVPIAQRWKAHLSGAEDASQALWNVLMYRAWARSLG